MSHTSTIDSIIITNIKALRATVKELNNAGVECSLLEDAIPRAYYTNQIGLEKAPFVIKLNKGKYDVGLYKNKDNSGYECRADFWNNDIATQLGVSHKNGVPSNQSNLGKLYQTYGVVAAEQQAIKQGYSTSRTVKKDGTVQLVLTAA